MFLLSLAGFAFFPEICQPNPTIICLVYFSLLFFNQKEIEETVIQSFFLTEFVLWSFLCARASSKLRFKIFKTNGISASVVFVCKLNTKLPPKARIPDFQNLHFVDYLAEVSFFSLAFKKLLARSLLLFH